MAVQHDRWISIEEYHELERNSETKYESLFALGNEPRKKGEEC